MEVCKSNICKIASVLGTYVLVQRCSRFLKKTTGYSIIGNQKTNKNQIYNLQFKRRIYILWILPLCGNIYFPLNHIKYPFINCLPGPSPSLMEEKHAKISEEKRAIIGSPQILLNFIRCQGSHTCKLFENSSLSIDCSGHENIYLVTNEHEQPLDGFWWNNNYNWRDTGNTGPCHPGRLFTLNSGGGIFKNMKLASKKLRLDISFVSSAKLMITLKYTQQKCSFGHYCGLNCVPQNSYVEDLTPRTSQRDCIWR